MNTVQTILSVFDSVTLADMDGVKLMDRRDVKFTLKSSQLPAILERLKAHYHVLEIESKRLATYNTLYYDTPEMAMYLRHHNGALNRYKIRFRTYVDSSLSFLEIKYKNNKGRTIKDRIKMKAGSQLGDARSAAFIAQKSPYSAEELVPVLWVNYKRITLVSHVFNERVTIDLDLEFHNNNRVVKMHDLVITEVKQSGRTRTPAMQVFKAFKVKEGSISKYCLAVATVCSGIKKNNFKEKLNYLNKLTHDHTIQSAAGYL